MAIWRKNSPFHGSLPNQWSKVNGVFRKNTSGTWSEVKKVWRRTNTATGQQAGGWSIAYDYTDYLPTPTTAPTLTSNAPTIGNSSKVGGWLDTDFCSGSTLTLTRGAWTNVTSTSSTTYQMRIERVDYLDTSPTDVAGPITYTGANSNSNTSISYATVSAYDAWASSGLSGYYFRGTVTVNNGTTINPYSVPSGGARAARVNINFSQSAVTSITANGGTLNWSASVIGDRNGIAHRDFIDRINIDIYRYDGGIGENAIYTLVKQYQYRPDGGAVQSGRTSFTPTISGGTSYEYVMSDPAIQSGFTHQAHIQVVANDNYKNQTATFGSTGMTLYQDIESFTPTAPLSIINLTEHDSTWPTFDRSGTDNRYAIPTGVSTTLRWQVTGVDNTATFRIRYRVYNWNTGNYLNLLDGSTGTASAVWTTYEDNYFGTGGISSVTINGSVATLYDTFYLDPSLFTGSFITGTDYRYSLEVEISAIKNGVSRVFYENSDYVMYYIGRSADSTISVSPTTQNINTNVTISGSFTGYPGGTAYPVQYRVDYGDGTNSGWLPVGGYAYNTGNPTFSLTKSYSTAGSYSISVQTIPYYEQSTAIVTIGTTPADFTYSISNISTVSSPSNPTHQRSTNEADNLVVIEVASTIPSDVDYFEVNTYGTGSSGNWTAGSPGNQPVSTLNDFNAAGSYVPGSGSFDAITGINTSASNSPISIFTRAYGKNRTIQANVSTQTGAQSWLINFSWSGASANSVTYYDSDVIYNSSSTAATVTVSTDTMPFTIAKITGSSNPTVTINSVVAYSQINNTGVSKNGVAGGTTSLSSIVRPTANSGVTTNNYTYYTNNQATGSQRRVNLPSNFTSGTTVYVSTNGYIGIGTDPSTALFPPSSGLFLMPLQGDQRQTALWTYSDSSNFYIRWQGARYNDAGQTIDYQAKFYWNSTAVDVHFVTNNLSSSNLASTTAVYNNGAITALWSGSSSQTSSLISTSSMARNTSQDGVDDNRTAIVASLPVSAPVNTVAPSVTPSSASAGSTFSCSTGTWSNSPTSYSYQWQYFEGGAFGWLSISGQTSSTFVSTGYGGLSIRCIVTATNAGGSNQATSNQASVTTAVSNATAPTSVTATGGNGTVSVSWSGATNATKYRVWWSTSSTGNGVDPAVSYDAETTSTSTSFSLTNGTTYYFWVSASNTNNVWTSYSSSPRGQATPSAPPAGTAPSTPTGLSNSYASGPSWTGSWSASTGTAPITYTWILYQSQSNGGSITATASGSTTGTSFTQSMSSSNGLWAYFTVYASNSIGTSGTATSSWA